MFNFLVMVLTASFSHEPGEPIRRLFVREEAHLYLGGHTDKRTARELGNHTKAQTRNWDFELKNWSVFWGRGFIAGERFEPTTNNAT